MAAGVGRQLDVVALLLTGRFYCLACRSGWQVEKCSETQLVTAFCWCLTVNGVKSEFTRIFKVRYPYPASWLAVKTGDMRYVLKAATGSLTNWVADDTISRLESSWDETVHTAAAFPFTVLQRCRLVVNLWSELGWSDWQTDSPCATGKNLKHCPSLIAHNDSLCKQL